MPTRPKTVRSINAMRKIVASWRKAGETIALVPTMGALHAGHLSLVKTVKRKHDRVIVTIFVNPAQFGPKEDLARYPRNEKSDLSMLAPLGVDLVFAPAPDEIYPEGFSTTVQVGGPATAGLEDRFRPHFFGGVATVVTKLLLQALPDTAIFGEKDYQQLMVISRFARDLDIPVKIVGGKTVREKDGLAMSSRNAYLDHAHRAAAPLLHATLQDAATKLRAGKKLKPVLASSSIVLEKAGFKVDYVEARHAETLAQIGSAVAQPTRLLVAAWLGTTRLIDNIAL